LRKVGPVTLQKVGLIPETGGVRVKDAIEAFLRYTDKPMITGRLAVLEGLSLACKERLLGIGRGLKPDNLQRRWCGEFVNLDPDEEGLWIIPPFSPEPEKASVVGKTDDETTPDQTKKTKYDDGNGGTGGGKQEAAVERIVIEGSVPLDNWAEVFRCFVSPAAKMKLKKLNLGIKFELVADDGTPLDPSHPTIKAMKEAARQLGLDIEIK
jgi:hypothetical protein